MHPCFSCTCTSTKSFGRTYVLNLVPRPPAAPCKQYKVLEAKSVWGNTTAFAPPTWAKFFRSSTKIRLDLVRGRHSRRRLTRTRRLMVRTAQRLAQTADARRQRLAEHDLRIAHAFRVVEHVVWGRALTDADQAAQDHLDRCPSDQPDELDRRQRQAARFYRQEWPR